MSSVFYLWKYNMLITIINLFYYHTIYVMLKVTPMLVKKHDKLKLMFLK